MSEAKENVSYRENAYIPPPPPPPPPLPPSSFELWGRGMITIVCLLGIISVVVFGPYYLCKLVMLISGWHFLSDWLWTWVGGIGCLLVPFIVYGVVWKFPISLGKESCK